MINLDYDYYEFLQKCKDLRDDLIRSDFCEEDKKHLDGYLDDLCGDTEFIINQIETDHATGI